MESRIDKWRGKSGEVNIRWEIIQGDSLSPLLLVLYLLPLTHILRDAAPEYHFASNGQKVTHLIFMNDLKLYASNEKSLLSLIQTMSVFSNNMGWDFEWTNVQYWQWRKERWPTVME